MSSPQIILVTGGNQGLGYSIIEVTAEREPSSIFILGSRNRATGDNSLQKLRSAGINSQIEVLELDVTNDEHISRAVDCVQGRYGRLDVLVNNAGILMVPEDDSLPALRHVYEKLCSVNLTSVAIVTHAFLPLLHKSKNPKVINITSGLGSIQNTLTKKMGRFPPYGAAKIGMNGDSMHQQTMENDRINAEAAQEEGGSGPLVKFYLITPGVLKTAFSRYSARGKDPRLGAESAVRIVTDHENKYGHALNWEFEEGDMRVVPW